MLAPFIKIPNLIKELAISQDIDPDSLVNDINQAQIYAEMLKGMQNAQQPTEQQQQSGGAEAALTGSEQPAGMAGPTEAPSGAQPSDLTGAGNGTIGTGAVPTVGEGQFAGNAPQLEE